MDSAGKNNFNKDVNATSDHSGEQSSSPRGVDSLRQESYGFKEEALSPVPENKLRQIESKHGSVYFINPENKYIQSVKFSDGRTFEVLEFRNETMMDDASGKGSEHRRAMPAKIKLPDGDIWEFKAREAGTYNEIWTCSDGRELKGNMDLYKEDDIDSLPIMNFRGSDRIGFSLYSKTGETKASYPILSPEEAIVLLNTAFNKMDGDNSQIVTMSELNDPEITGRFTGKEALAVNILRDYMLENGMQDVTLSYITEIKRVDDIQVEAIDKLKSVSDQWKKVDKNQDGKLSSLEIEDYSRLAKDQKDNSLVADFAYLKRNFLEDEIPRKLLDDSLTTLKDQNRKSYDHWCDLSRWSSREMAKAVPLGMSLKELDQAKEKLTSELALKYSVNFSNNDFYNGKYLNRAPRYSDLQTIFSAVKALPTDLFNYYQATDSTSHHRRGVTLNYRVEPEQENTYEKTLAWFEETGDVYFSPKETSEFERNLRVKDKDVKQPLEIAVHEFCHLAQTLLEDHSQYARKLGWYLENGDVDNSWLMSKDGRHYQFYLADKDPSQTYQSYWKSQDKELTEEEMFESAAIKPVSSYWNNYKEAFAEVMTSYFLDPKDLQKDDPKAFSVAKQIHQDLLKELEKRRREDEQESFERYTRLMKSIPPPK